MNPIFSEMLKNIPAMQKKAEVNTLKPGQMVSGKVSVLYPNNQALIHIGSAKVHAQLETSLTKGERYLFLVKSTGDQIHLKVVSDPRTKENAITKPLGFQLSKHAEQLLNELFKKEIAFTSHQLQKAASLLEQAGNKAEAKQVLLEMFARKLPIHKPVFEALLKRSRISLSKQLNELSSSLDSKPLFTASDKRMSPLLSLLKGQDPLPFSEFIVQKFNTEINDHSTASFRLFQKAHIISDQYSFSAFQENVKWGETATPPNGTGRTPQLTLKDFPFGSQNPKQIAEKIIDLFTKQLPFSEQEQKVFTQWRTLLESLLKPSITSAKSSSIDLHTSQNQLMQLYQQLQEFHSFEKILPFFKGDDAILFKQAVERLPQVLSNEKSGAFQSGLFSLLEQLKAIDLQQVPKELKVPLAEWAGHAIHESQPGIDKHIFLVKMKTVMNLLGINHEALLKESGDSLENVSTVKSNLMQGLNDSASLIKPDAAKQLLHFLNGLQLTAHQETNQTIQMTMQFPGGLLEIADDIYVDIQGRKKRDKIDPDFCHVMFFLDLKSLKETVVDLKIMNRRVNLTVYNEDKRTAQAVEKHKESLHAGLDALGYTLSNVAIKSMSKASEKKARPGNQLNYGREGLDVRI
ncbi:hypothetical protein MUN89_14070 [Halobacillus salinarum]|uniref:Flagellar hook-length control protein-like C-terminal domain-containing protein n=1 Tax=Halobacillus salinarum TaxID=2932257 RepID=A0ABY4EG06_9BACI|nr:hypothetical protein [Halobacillus salinarum]UOQ43069.1 hypothetical protein MUN89_14070 [Halobacillus salinarum]